MELDILNQILTTTVGSLFHKGPSVQSGLREVPSWINKPQQQTQQLARITPAAKHEKKKSSGDLTNNGNLQKEESLLFNSVDSGPSVQKGTDYTHNKSRSIDNSFDKRMSGSSFASLNTSSSSLQPVSRPEAENRSNYSSTTLNSSNSGQFNRQNLTSKPEPPSMERWIKKDGPQKLQDALTNLNLDLRTVKKVNLSAFTYEQLNTEKKNVKNELKNYDSYFAAIFKRTPEREEKEPMRPLYIYYKKIKQYIILNSDKIKASKNSDNAAKNSKTFKGPGLEKENRSTTGFPERKLETSFEVQLSRDTFKDRGTLNFGVGDRDDFEERHSRQTVSRGGQVNPQGSGLSQEHVRRQLEEYKNFRQLLREKLHSYQTEFTRNNNRKIKYHNDIAPVAEEYKRYKDIKHEINRLESLLSS